MFLQESKYLVLVAALVFEVGSRGFECMHLGLDNIAVHNKHCSELMLVDIMSARLRDEMMRSVMQEQIFLNHLTNSRIRLSNRP